MTTFIISLLLFLIGTVCVVLGFASISGGPNKPWYANYVTVGLIYGGILCYVAAAIAIVILIWKIAT